MRVSGKITHSFYCFLQAREFDISRLYALTDLEMEFLKDPTQWLPIEPVESFLKSLKNEYNKHFLDKNFLTTVGHSCFELGAWGDLDSVLKMQSNRPVFSNLPVFLSYFVSDGFFLIPDRNEPQFLSFKCSLSSEAFPFVTEYLRSTLETLPVYTGKNHAEVKWIRNYVQIEWEEKSSQASLFSEPLNTNIKPEILSDLKHFLEKVEKELYSQRQNMEEKDKQIRNLKDQLLLQGLPLSEDMAILLKKIQQDLLSLKESVVGNEVSGEVFNRKIESLLENLSQLQKGLNF